MTVGDLIERLQQIPRHYKVMVPSIINVDFDQVQDIGFSEVQDASEGYEVVYLKGRNAP